MVEGPGATRNATKARTLVGWTSPKYGILKRSLSVGKEVFLVFASSLEQQPEKLENALRLHFGMNGSLIVGKKGEKRLENNAKWKGNPSLVITFENGVESRVLECYAATTNSVTPFVALSKYDRLHCQDVCSPDFEAYSVLEALLKRPANMLADVILDQSRFPGVGNIIKIEALHDAKLNPKRLVSQCSQTDLLRLIQKCRDFAMLWLKRGRAPYKNVYNQTHCQTCKLQTVKIEKMGNDLSRTTFWCSHCQLAIDEKERTVISKLLPRAPLSQKNVSSSPSSISKSSISLPPLPAQCPQHGSQKLRLKRVRKATLNQGRLFLNCQPQQCKFFAWADLHLKKCCRSVCTLKMSKTSKTGGQWFLTCSKGCGYFAWATDKDLQPFGKKLTPLL